MIQIGIHNAKKLLEEEAKKQGRPSFFKDEAREDVQTKAPARSFDGEPTVPFSYSAEAVRQDRPRAQKVRNRHRLFAELKRMNGCTYDGTMWIRAIDRNFYRQAVLMEEFTDDYAGNEAYYAYRPSYADMSDRQLRTYFTWRTAVRKGIFERTAPSYMTLYTYELINRIGVKNNRDGLDVLLRFWRGYRELDQSIDKTMFRLLKHYYICYETGISYPEFLLLCPVNPEEERDLKEALFLEDFSCKLSYLNSLSSYKILESRFYPGNETALEACLEAVLKSLSVYYKEHGRILAEELVGEMRRGEVWRPFSDSIYLETDSFDRRVALGEYECYERKNGRWTMTAISEYHVHSGLVGYILKVMEARLRERTGFRYKLSPNIAKALKDGFYTREEKSFVRGKQYTEAIVQATDRFFCESGIRFLGGREEAAKTPSERVAIDLSKLAAIRRQAEELERKLVIEETAEDAGGIRAEERARQETEQTAGIELQQEIPGYGKGDSVKKEMKRKRKKKPPEEQTKGIFVQEEMPEAAAAPFSALLTPEEQSYVRFILAGNGAQKEVFCGTWQELLAESINEKALSYFGDIIIENGEIYKEYLDKMKEGL